MSNLKNNFTIIGLAILIIVVSNILGHFFPPFSIFATPFLMILIIARLNNPLYKSKFKFTILYNVGLLLFNDLFIRFYAGGTHDQEGKGLISLFFVITFIFAIVSMIVYAVILGFKDEKIHQVKIISFNILITLTASIILGFLYYHWIGNI